MDTPPVPPRPCPSLPGSPEEATDSPSLVYLPRRAPSPTPTAPTVPVAPLGRERRRGRDAMSQTLRSASPRSIVSGDV